MPVVHGVSNGAVHPVLCMPVLRRLLPEMRSREKGHVKTSKIKTHGIDGVL